MAMTIIMIIFIIIQIVILIQTPVLLLMMIMRIMIIMIMITTIKLIMTLKILIINNIIINNNDDSNDDKDIIITLTTITKHEADGNCYAKKRKSPTAMPRNARQEKRLAPATLLSRRDLAINSYSEAVFGPESNPRQSGFVGVIAGNGSIDRESGLNQLKGFDVAGAQTHANTPST